MTVTKTEENGKITLALDGWLDNLGAPEVGAMIDGITEACEIILDFDAVEYMSSAGVRQVVAAHRAAKALEAAFSVVNVSAEVMSIFEMTGLNTKLAISKKAE